MDDELIIQSKCPKCRSRSFTVLFCVETEAAASVKNGVVRHWGMQGFVHPITANATYSKCGYEWRMRDPNIAWSGH